jgi:hypothetical protein
VLVNKRGRLFHARVLGTGTGGGLSLEPLDRRITWRQATAREVIDHWTHARRDSGERPSTDQLAFDDMPGE